MEQQRLPRWRRFLLPALFVLTLGTFGYQRAQEPRWTKADALLLADTAFKLGAAARCGTAAPERQVQLDEWVSVHFVPFPEQFQALRQAKFAAGYSMPASRVQCESVQRALAETNWGAMRRRWYQW